MNKSKPTTCSRTPKNYKNFSSNISTISKFETVGSIPISIIGHEECKAELIRTADTISLHVEGAYYNSEKECTIILEGKKFAVKTSDVITNSFNVDVETGLSQSHNFGIKTIEDIIFASISSAKYRCFFPTKLDNIKSFCFILDTTHYESDTARYAFDCVRIKIGATTYDIVQVKENNAGYYVIENLEDDTYDSFKENCFAIQQSLGFLTGYMPGGSLYIFANDRLHYSLFVRPSLKSFYNPVNTNAYSNLYDNKKAAEIYQGKLTKIPTQVFSNLVNLVKEDDALSMAVILLMEAASAKSLLLIPSVFAVIIESFAKSNSAPEKGKSYPMNDTCISKKVINDLIRVIDSNKGILSEDGALKLKQRILNINNPVIKERLTNIDKLTLPFKQLGIKLSIEDITVIEHRNDLLHGNISLENGESRTGKMINSYMMYTMDRLYTLISKLLLKLAGYEGYIINHSKWSEQSAAINTSEDYYVKI